MSKRFKKDDIILHRAKEYICIVCDDEIAAFGRHTKIKRGTRTDYKKSFFVSNYINDDGFKYEFIKK